MTSPSPSNRHSYGVLFIIYNLIVCAELYSSSQDDCQRVNGYERIGDLMIVYNWDVKRSMPMLSNYDRKEIMTLISCLFQYFLRYIL